ncbi:hypothetical protein PG991_002004 [Apiospora marii]|uniref:IBR domain-containing protein n=1 Tax=Apiospora marii TaxID=335849 RepID=A0ABR1SQ06_9PEZI
MASTISAFKAAGCDVLVGHVAYPCDHEFGYVRDYTLDRTDDGRWDCPKCPVQGEERQRQEPWDANATASCPHCDSFFCSGLLEERVAAIEAKGLKWARDSVGHVVSRSMQLKWKETRKERLLALSAAAKSETEK